MIINLLNEQPDDVLQGMEQWLSTQFDHDDKDGFDTEQYNLKQFEDWRELPEHKERSEILAKCIPRAKIEELRAEVQDFEQLLNDIKHSDNKYISISEYMKRVKGANSSHQSSRTGLRNNLNNRRNDFLDEKGQPTAPGGVGEAIHGVAAHYGTLSGSQDDQRDLQRTMSMQDSQQIHDKTELDLLESNNLKINPALVHGETVQSQGNLPGMVELALESDKEDFKTDRSKSSQGMIHQPVDLQLVNSDHEDDKLM